MNTFLSLIMRVSNFFSSSETLVRRPFWLPPTYGRANHTHVCFKSRGPVRSGKNILSLRMLAYQCDFCCFVDTKLRIWAWERDSWPNINGRYVRPELHFFVRSTRAIFLKLGNLGAEPRLAPSDLRSGNIILIYASKGQEHTPQVCLWNSGASTWFLLLYWHTTFAIFSQAQKPWGGAHSGILRRTVRQDHTYVCFESRSRTVGP